MGCWGPMVYLGTSSCSGSSTPVRWSSLFIRRPSHSAENCRCFLNAPNMGVDTVSPVGRVSLKHPSRVFYVSGTAGILGTTSDLRTSYDVGSQVIFATAELVGWRAAFKHPAKMCVKSQRTGL